MGVKLLWLNLNILCCIAGVCLLSSVSCGGNRESGKKPILLADREAPLGWVYLRVFEDFSFEFESRGLRDGNVFPGILTIKSDSIFFEYSDSIPNVGQIAILSKSRILYIDGYGESMEIRLNELDSK